MRAFIHDAIAKHTIVLDNKHHVIIETILNNMPRPLDRIYLPRWCRNFVQPYMAQIEHHIPQCQNICELVRKELLLILYKPHLNKLASLALNAKTKINPIWIEKKCRMLGRTLKKQFRTSEGKIDWQLIADQSGINHVFSFHIQNRRNLSTAIQELTALLETEKPHIFNGEWIRHRNPRLCEHLAINYRNLENLPDWPRIIALLDAHWQKRWKYRKLARGKTLKQAIDLLLTALRIADPKQFGPAWVETHVPFTYRFFRYHVKTKTEKINWQVLC
ncbi:MAG: hypothetical protein AAB975_04415, partial [Patescibacteria group bacterium]